MSTDAPKVTEPTPSKADYKSTLNLPKTDFPMKADLVKNEPGRLAKWKASDLYARVQLAHADDPAFILHDGPPFANGDIHIGHVINKTLKDVVLKYKTMAGHRAPYVPGWDCHGLPIEHKIQEEIGPKWRELPQGRDPQALLRLRTELRGQTRRTVRTPRHPRRLRAPVSHDGAGV